MTGLEVGILAAGLVFVIVSFLLPGKGEGKTAEISEEDMERAVRKLKEATTFQEEELKRKVQDIVEKSSTELIQDAEADMKRLSNEKIMAIDEFSNQVLGRIEHNNQEVIFLYDMFQKKEEEMKAAMNKMEQTRRENKELLDSLEALNKVQQKVLDAKEAATGEEWDALQGEEKTRKDQQEFIDGARRTQADALAESVTKQAAEESEAKDTAVYGEKERRNKILELYRKNYDIKEISKELSIGQGEIKLIIDLYGNTK